MKKKARWLNMRFPAFSSFLLGVSLSISAAAQSNAPACDDQESAKRDTVAELREVQGNVLVSDSQGMATGVDNQRLKNKVRVTTTSRAGVLVHFDCGCDVRLKENERLDVESPRACAALLASVQAVPIGAPIGAVAPVATTGISTPGLLITTGVGVGAYLLYRNNRNVSPN
ncbi:MAG: hypothetical protein LC098_08025 [Burkholderiales bacterium]|nr:hypothetical protein [Burkholderiales bacterium]